MMVSNGLSNGHGRRRSEEDELATITLRRLINELCTEVTTVHTAITLGPTDDGLKYVRTLEKAIFDFVNKARKNLEEADQRCAQTVHASNRDSVRSHIERMNEALGEIEHGGKELVTVGSHFVGDLFSSAKRNDAVAGSHEVLAAVTRFLLLCDKLDVFFIFEGIDIANALLHDLRNARTPKEVEERFSMLMNVLAEVDESTCIRLAELKPGQSRDDLLAARALVKSSCPVVHSATKAVLRHPEPQHAEACDFAHDEMRMALERMRAALIGESVPGGFASSSLEDYGRLARELEEFQNTAMMDPAQYKGAKDRAGLEELLERIVTGSAVIADEISTRTDRKHKIIEECNNLRQALQDLLKEYESNKGRAEQSEDVDLAMVLVGRRTRDLKRHLRRAIVDNVSDAYLDHHTPISNLIHAASTGDEMRTHECAEGRGGFIEHAKRLITVARLATEMSTDQEGMRHVKHTTELIERLVPQVVAGAYLLCRHPDSAEAQEHMEVLRKLWISKVEGLTLAVDALLSLDDFLAVSESHIVEDAMKGVEAIHEVHAAKLDINAGALRGRCLHVCQVVEEEMACCDWGDAYVEDVKSASMILRENVDVFAAQAEKVIGILETNTVDTLSPQDRDAGAQEFMLSCQLVLDSVKAIRNALLINRNPEDVDSDNEYEDDGTTHIDQKSTVSDVENQQKIMRRLPEEDKRKIEDQIAVFKITQTKFENEVAKWDEAGNDIVVLAKHMCIIMMNMTDFTRGRGPLKSTMDVIRAAQEISTAGQKLSVLARQIGEEAEENNARNEHLKKTKADLLAYLDKMTLFCQQLNICSKVKADVQQVGDELRVNGLDSAMSLIQTARNLLSAVVSTVKNAYIISTKFRSMSTAPRVEWKMTKPKKQPLVTSTQQSTRNHGIVRRASEKRPMPMHALQEFTR